MEDGQLQRAAMPPMTFDNLKFVAAQFNGLADDLGVAVH